MNEERICQRDGCSNPLPAGSMATRMYCSRACIHRVRRVQVNEPALGRRSIYEADNRFGAAMAGRRFEDDRNAARGTS